MTSEIYEKLQAGIQHQHDGELIEAEQLYREILDESPDHPDALHLLGVLAYQIGDYDVAEELIRHAIQSDYQVADYHNNLGEVLRVTDRLEEAEKQYTIALSIDPTHENANQNLEKLAIESPRQAPSAEHIPEVRHALPSYILSMDDEPNQPNRYLLDLSLLAASKASKLTLQSIKQRFDENTAQFIDVWPGEHYRLLASLVEILAPKLIIDIGTAKGTCTLTMKDYLPEDGRIITYDIVPWKEYPGSVLQETDFDSQLQQRLVDLGNPAQSTSEHNTLEQADIIFVDATKDAVIQQQFCELFDSLKFRKPPLVIFDDIRIMPMLKIWRNIQHPKLDITSFGHWSGTGLVEWDNNDKP